MKGNIKNGDEEFIQVNRFMGSMEYKLEVHIHSCFFVDIDEQHLTIHPIEFCASWHISAQVADDQVYSKAFEVSDVANTDHGLITFFRPKSSKVIADDVG